MENIKFYKKNTLIYSQSCGNIAFLAKIRNLYKIKKQSLLLIFGAGG